VDGSFYGTPKILIAKLGKKKIIYVCHCLFEFPSCRR